MSKKTPFFKFDSSAWLGGSIQFTDLETKGLFVDLCALYWNSTIPIIVDTKLKVRTRCPEGTLTNLIGTLTDLGIIEQSELGITIPFLDELKKERTEFLQKCSIAGKNKGTKKGTSSNKKEERRKKNEEYRKENKEKYKKELLVFDDFRKLYPGSKRGLETEFSNFQKKHKDWKAVLPELTDLLKCQINQRVALAASKQFVPQWKHLQTWINQRCWEEEQQALPAKPEFDPTGGWGLQS